MPFLLLRCPGRSRYLPMRGLPFRTLCHLICCCAISALALAAAPVSGEAVYQKRCAGCHDQNSDRIPRRQALQQMPATRIMRALDFGATMTVAYPMTARIVRPSRRTSERMPLPSHILHPHIAAIGPLPFRIPPKQPGTAGALPLPTRATNPPKPRDSTSTVYAN